MKSLKSISVTILFGHALVWILIGCSSITVTVPVTRPAEINLNGKNELVIGDIKGRGGEKAAAYIKELAIESGRFKVITRDHLNDIMRELKLSQSDLADAEGRKKLGKLMSGSILIMGELFDYSYKEDITREKATCYRTRNGETREYTCTEYTRTGRAIVRGSFDVIEIETGQNLKSKALESAYTSTTSQTDGKPAPINTDALFEQSTKDIAQNLMKAIAPWTETVPAKFEKDGKLPMMESGIAYAQAGQWNDALGEFRAAVQTADSDSKIPPKAAGRAYWNLGLAFEYSCNYDDAVRCIKKAYALSSNKEYLMEIKNVEKMKADQRKLQEQLSQ